MKGIIYLEDGTVFYGTGFGKLGTSVGEIVFNTSITGYQEILTDPSYAGQIITMSYPLIGNYGVNSIDNESNKIYAKGLIVKSISNEPSNCLSENNLDNMLKRMGIVAVCGVDTRAITKKVRDVGSMKCVISNENLSIDEIKLYITQEDTNQDYMEEVSTKEIIRIPGTGPKVALMDFGVKSNIIRNLKEFNCDITVFPYNSSYEQIMSTNPEGILLSNGPGNPKDVVESIETVKKLIGKIPMFGICLGHQILALAMGADTYKLKYGHRGGNHGVYDIEKDRAYITSQNHGYAVDPESLKDKDIIITHKNLNDNTIEGIRHKYLPVFSVQFHPEGAPGPTDSAYLFAKFVDLMEKDNKQYLKGETACL